MPRKSSRSTQNFRRSPIRFSISGPLVRLPAPTTVRRNGREDARDLKAGLALEYSLVERATLAVRPIAGELLATADPSGPTRCAPGLALHGLRLETAEPVASLSGVGEAFQARLRELGARLE